MLQYLFFYNYRKHHNRKKAQIHFPYIEADGRISAEDKKVIIQHTKGIALQKSVRHRVTHLTV